MHVVCNKDFDNQISRYSLQALVVFTTSTPSSGWVVDTQVPGVFLYKTEFLGGDLENTRGLQRCPV